MNRAHLSVVVAIIVFAAWTDETHAIESRPYVGIIPDGTAQGKGVTVKGVVKNGPADKAGVKAADVIIKVDADEVQGSRDFVTALQSRIGRMVKLVVKRGDKEMTLTIIPFPRPVRAPVKRSPSSVAGDGTVTFGHTATVCGMAIFPDGKRVLSASLREDYVWELATAKDLGQFTGARSLAVAISRDGKRVAIEGFDALTIHDAETNKKLLSFNPHGDWNRKFPFRPTIEAMTFSADNRLLATAGSFAKVGGRHGYPGGIVKVWDTATGKEIRSFGRCERGAFLPHRAGSVALSSDGKYVAAGTFGAGGELPDAALFSVWEVDSGRQILSARMHEKISVTDNPCNVRAVIFHPDGKHVLTGGLDNKLRVWDLSSGKLAEIRDMTRRQSAGIAAFSPDAKLLAFGGVGLVSIHEVSTGKEVKSFLFDVRRIQSLAFSPDNKWLVAGGGNSFHSGQAKAWKIAD